MENQTVVERLRSAHPDAIVAVAEQRGDVHITVHGKDIVTVARFLRDDPELHYIFLENLCGVDYLGREPRFEVVYHLLSFTNRHRVCLKVGLPEDDPTVPSLTALWPTANWQERETYDMFGIIFSGHPSLKRILLPDEWEGYPQRKDVPLGAEEVAFTPNVERIDAHKPYARE
jgi:NADH-quinone oxidoreductase subunit C